MAEFPCDPQMAKSIIIADKYGCVAEAISVGAMLSAGNAVYYRPKDRAVRAGAGRARDAPKFQGSALGRRRLVSADVWTERSSLGTASTRGRWFPGTRARGTVASERRRAARVPRRSTRTTRA